MEVDDRAVRAAVWTFQHPINCPRFVLFPMAHIAEPAFYKNVTARVGRSDLAVVEGIVGKSRHAKAIVSIYDVIARMDHLGLVVENIDYRAMSTAAGSAPRSGTDCCSGHPVWPSRLGPCGAMQPAASSRTSSTPRPGA
jgi:hypothetical protein